VSAGGIQIFLSYAGADAFEASLLQYAVESLLVDMGAKVWTYQRDQSRDQQTIAFDIKSRIHQSRALIFLVSPATIELGTTQWMEFAYADAFGIPIFVLLNHLTYNDLRARGKGVPPLLLQTKCNDATTWPDVIQELRSRLMNAPINLNEAP
jgi:hypothetical protein